MSRQNRPLQILRYALLVDEAAQRYLALPGLPLPKLERFYLPTARDVARAAREVMTKP